MIVTCICTFRFYSADRLTGKKRFGFAINIDTCVIGVKKTGANRRDETDAAGRI